MPEKAQKQYNFCLLRSDGEPFVFTVQGDGNSISYNFADPNMSIVGKEGATTLETVLNHYMRKNGVKVTHPNEVEFVGAIPESHRKGEKAYHVKAFRGSKDGRYDSQLPRRRTDISSRLPLLP